MDVALQKKSSLKRRGGLVRGSLIHQKGFKMLDISFIRDKILDTATAYGINLEATVGDGKIFYLNEDINTEAALLSGESTCEFALFYKSTEWAAVILRQRRNEIEIRVYSESDPDAWPVITYEESPFDLHDLSLQLKGSFDDMGAFNKPVPEWTLPVVGWAL